jgi:hypothetical protein
MVGELYAMAKDSGVLDELDYAVDGQLTGILHEALTALGTPWVCSELGIGDSDTPADSIELLQRFGLHPAKDLPMDNSRNLSLSPWLIVGVGVVAFFFVRKFIRSTGGGARIARGPGPAPVPYPAKSREVPLDEPGMLLLLLTAGADDLQLRKDSVPASQVADWVKRSLEHCVVGVSEASSRRSRLDIAPPGEETGLLLAQVATGRPVSSFAGKTFKGSIAERVVTFGDLRVEYFSLQSTRGCDTVFARKAPAT